MAQMRAWPQPLTQPSEGGRALRGAPEAVWGRPEDWGGAPVGAAQAQWAHGRARRADAAERGKGTAASASHRNEK